MSYRFLPHTADLILEISGASLADLFNDATSVMRALTVGNGLVEATESHLIELQASSPDELLIRFIRELLVHFQIDTFVPANLVIYRLSPSRISATVHGERFDDSKHEPQPEIKAATRHRLSVEEVEGGWHAVVVLDL
ncbi:MAG: archease [Gemmatimonadota bacterium]|nr:MAG: archease [Gemmatimonadota bacterium]